MVARPPGMAGKCDGAQMKYSAGSTPEWLKNKRDKNEPAIVARIRQLGGEWFACSRHEGHDGWVLYHREWYCCEIKNPAEKWTFTAAEARMCTRVQQNGGLYFVLQAPEDVDYMLDEMQAK
jgi:hypothetical protein